MDEDIHRMEATRFHAVHDIVDVKGEVSDGAKDEVRRQIRIQTQLLRFVYKIGEMIEVLEAVWILREGIFDEVEKVVEGKRVGLGPVV